MSTRKIALTTAAALAAAALSACSVAHPGAGSLSSVPTVAVSPASAVDTPVSVPTTAASRWISLDAAPVLDKEKDIAGYRFGALTPGTGIWEHSDTVSKDAGCTAGPAIAPTMSRDSRGYATAGHCDKPDRTQVLTFADAAHGASRFIGVYTPAPPTGRSIDATSLWLTSAVGVPAAVADHPVAGVLTKSAVQELPTAFTESTAATKVCVYGAVTGLACGDLLFTDELTVKVHTTNGDSGAPMFLLNGDTGAVTLIGLLTKSADDNSYGVFMDSALDELGAVAVVDKDASAAVKGDPRYSGRTVTTP